MKISVTTAFLLFFFSSCRQQQEVKPDAERVIRDTLAFSTGNIFTTRPPSAPIRVEAAVSDEDIPLYAQPRINLKPEVQIFRLCGRQGTAIKGNKGTTLSIPQETFIKADGTVVKDTFTLVLKECFVPADFWQAELNMTSAGQLLHCDAAISVEAFLNEERLYAAPGKAYTLTLPSLIKRTAGKSFFRSVNGSDWTAFRMPENLHIKSGDNFENPVFEDFRLRISRYLTAHVQYPEDARRNELSALLSAGFTITAAGEVTDVVVTGGYKTFRDEVAKVIREMPLLRPAILSDAPAAYQFSMNFQFNLRENKQITVTENEQARRLIRDVVSAQTNRAGLQTIECTAMGWTCYARAVRADNTGGDLIVPCDKNTRVALWLDKKNCLIQIPHYAGYARMKGLPLNEPVTVIAIGVREEMNSSFYVGRFQTARQMLLNPVWQRAATSAVIQTVSLSLRPKI